jgi:NAD-dependent SIR2 family protein deacetylase
MRQSAISEPLADHNPENCKRSECELCKVKRPFELPQEVVDAYTNGNLVVFAGAGISTESHGVYPCTFYKWVKDTLGLSAEQEISFSKLMTRYCLPPRSRKVLLEAIKQRIDYVKSFPELYNRATEFHRELSTIPHLDEIFTTNWDDFFERECNATPVVTGEDFAVVQDTPGRKVFKIHGSINNFGSIIATEQDYAYCYRRLSKGIVGAKLKLLLMSKTVLFFGFSFTDEDFLRLYRFLSKEVGGLIPRSYVITLDEKAKDKLSTLGINTSPIITSAAFFISQFKKKLVEDKRMLPDQQYDGIDLKLESVYEEHYRLSKIGLAKHPDAFYALSYQDGFIHAFERLLAMKNSGEYSCVDHVINLIKSYDQLIKDCLHRRKYHDVAYFDGYKAGLLYFILDDKQRKLIPSYFLFRSKEPIMSIEQYIELEKNAAQLHKRAHKYAKRVTKGVSKGFVFHHTPFT